MAEFRLEFSKGVWTVELSEVDGLPNEAYLLACPDGVVLIDTGYTVEDLRRIEDRLEEIGRGWKDIRLILITHEHGDHIENLRKLKELTGAQVMAGEGDIRGIEAQTGVRVDKGLRHGDYIDVCGGIEAIHIPGHSVGNMSFYLQRSKTVIVGDTIFQDERGNLIPPPEKYSLDVEMARNEIKRLLFYDFDTLLLSHGKNLLKGAKSRIRSFCEALEAQRLS
ncbi:MAG: MBL fold metallo-hydrolase [Candidatus Bathyarchaeia archaeon]